MTTWVGRYAIVGGQVQEHGPWLVDRQRQREEEVLRLLVLTEPSDVRSADFCKEVAEAVASLFARESLSITGGLLRALRQAHGNLSEWNRRSLREHRVSIGVTCVAIRDGEATIAQVGPGVAYLAGPERIERLGTEGTPAAQALGGDAAIEPMFTATPLAGHEILLLSSAAEPAIGREVIEEALVVGPERALAELFRRTRGVPDMTAVLVADLDIDETQEAEPLDYGTEGRTSMRAAGTPARGGSDWGDTSGPVVSRPDVDSGPPVERRRPSQRKAGSRLPSLRRPRTVGRAGRGGGAAVPWRLAGLVAGLAAVIALLAWALLPRLLDQDRAAELDRALAAATQQISAADSATGPNKRRQALQQALVEVEKARAISSQDPRVEAVEKSARERLDLLDAITNVEQLTPVLTFAGTLTVPLNPEQLVVGERAVWLMESGRGRVFRVDPQTQNSAIEVYRAGESYSRTTARDPVAIAWDGSKNRLLVLDAGRTLFSIGDDASARPVVIALRGAADLKSTVAMTAYLGNLYILDSAGGEVWRYLPAGYGFDSERTGALGGAEIAQASELAVDGDIFLLDGVRLRHFRQGREQAALLQGIDKPLQAPIALSEDLLRGILYVADRGNRRIVAGDRELAFQRQYRHADFGDLRGVGVSSDGARVYILTGDRIAWFQPRPPSVAPGGVATPVPSITATPSTTATPTPTATPTATPAR
ncbi:MAG: hypothetical protein FJ037_00350 [Chloroflexi bacterium]|nr:hypothetical protein [Chloroflexota bacterium]